MLYCRCAIFSCVGLVFWLTIPVYSSHYICFVPDEEWFYPLETSVYYCILYCLSAQQFSLLVPVHLYCFVLVFYPIIVSLPTPSWHILFFTQHFSYSRDILLYWFSDPWCDLFLRPLDSSFIFYTHHSNSQQSIKKHKERKHRQLKVYPRFGTQFQLSGFEAQSNNSRMQNQNQREQPNLAEGKRCQPQRTRFQLQAVSTDAQARSLVSCSCYCGNVYYVCG